MSNSSRLCLENELSSLELPIFLTPSDVTFSPDKKKARFIIFNPYGKEAQFNIVTTSPERFHISNTGGVLKPNRRAEITIRLYPNRLDDLPLPTDDVETIDYFKIHVQIGPLRGVRSMKVCWSSYAVDELDEGHSSNQSIGSNDNVKSSSSSSNKLRIKTLKSNIGNIRSTDISNPQMPKTLAKSSKATNISTRGGNYQANLVCTVGGLFCVCILFMPLTIDMEKCKKLQTTDEETSELSGFWRDLMTIFSVNYELKLVCSFALGLFTYRLISTMPD